MMLPAMQGISCVERREDPMRAGATLLELAIVLSVIAIVLGISVPRFNAYRDAISTHAAASSIAGLLAGARHDALRRSAITAARFDTSTGEVVIHASGDTIQRRPLGAIHGVRLKVSRDSIAFSPNGMGYGAANAQIIVSRGTAAETVVVSRLGRVRHER
jgi:Tfp pilus assembly protein FimT